MVLLSIRLALISGLRFSIGGGEDPVLVVELSFQLLERFGSSELAKVFAEVDVVVVHCRKALFFAHKFVIA